MIFNGQHQGTVREQTTSENELCKHSSIRRLTNLFNQRINDFPSLLQLIVKEVAQVLGKEWFCLIFLNNPQRHQLELVAKTGISAEQLSFLKTNSAESELLTKVFVTGKSQFSQKENQELENLQPSEGIIPNYIYAVAIESSQAGKLGVLGIGSWSTADRFDLDAQNFVDAIGEIAAIAIDNATLFKSARERETLLIRENEMLRRDNLQLEKTRHQIQLQNLELLEVAQLKSQFLSTTSHELRTPLNVILGLSQVLLRQRTSSLSEQQIDIIQRILNNGNHLQALIDDMLCFARVEAGRLSFQTEEFNLKALIIGTVNEYHSSAEQKRLSLNHRIALYNPLVMNDKIRLKQLLSKLLQNAIKFTEAGTIDVKVWETEEDKITIAIEDTGIGIAEYDLEQIFEEFWQVDQTNTRKYGGTGLGLAIAKSLVEIMEGKIFVTSKVGQGSIFRIELPRDVECKGCNW